MVPYGKVIDMSSWKIIRHSYTILLPGNQISSLESLPNSMDRTGQRDKPFQKEERKAWHLFHVSSRLISEFFERPRAFTWNEVPPLHSASHHLWHFSSFILKAKCQSLLLQGYKVAHRQVFNFNNLMFESWDNLPSFPLNLHPMWINLTLEQDSTQGQMVLPSWAIKLAAHVLPWSCLRPVLRGSAKRLISAAGPQLGEVITFSRPVSI